MPDKREEQHLDRVREALEERKEEAQASAEEHSIESHQRPQNVESVRAKSSGHKKKTADKWNQ